MKSHTVTTYKYWHIKSQPRGLFQPTSSKVYTDCIITVNLHILTWMCVVCVCVCVCMYINDYNIPDKVHTLQGPQKLKLGKPAFWEKTHPKPFSRNSTLWKVEEVWEKKAAVKGYLYKKRLELSVD